VFFKRGEKGVGGKKKSNLSDRQVEARKTRAAQAARDRAARQAAQADAHARNVQAAKAGLLTPWEAACRERAGRRLAAGVRDVNREAKTREAS